MGFVGSGVVLAGVLVSVWGAGEALFGAVGAWRPISSTEKRLTVYTSGIFCLKFKKLGIRKPKSKKDTCRVMVKNRDFCHCLSGSLDVGRGKGTVSMLSF